jgi:hypothetical protein
MEQNPFGKLIESQLFKNLPSFCETRRFITMFMDYKLHILQMYVLERIKLEIT